MTNLEISSAGDAPAACCECGEGGERKAVECRVLCTGVLPGEQDQRLQDSVIPDGADGKPDLSAVVFDPPKTKWNVQGATLVLNGAESLGGDWHEVNKANESDKAKMRFFKVEVEMP